MKQLLKSLHLLRESGEVVVMRSVVGSVETDGVFTNICYFYNFYFFNFFDFFCYFFFFPFLLLQLLLIISSSSSGHLLFS